MSVVIGIDLGTTNSLAAIWKDGKSVLIPNSFGEYLTPSVVSVDDDGHLYVGKVAKERQVTHPQDTASIFKRSMGTNINYILNNKKYTAEELSSFVLKRLKQDAENYLGETVEEAVISVPAYFDNMARMATKRAGELAGLTCERIVNEPSAAALACYDMKKDTTILVFDFGGGTLDVSLVECFGNVVEIIGVSGDNRLGGSDFDDVILGHYIRHQKLDYYKLTDEQKAIIRQAAEKCKRELSEHETGTIVVNEPEIQGMVRISRKELIQLSAELFRRMEIPIYKVLKDSDLELSDIDDVVLVGGSCKMPIVQQYLKHILKRKDIQVRNPDHMIALGLGTYVGIKERNQDIKDMVLTDICPFSLGVGIINEENPEEGNIMSVIIPRNTTLPVSQTSTYVTVHDNQKQLVFRIYQGEGKYVKNNIYLGELSIKVPPRPKGESMAQVRFSYDMNGVLQVKVKSMDSKKEQEIVIVKDKKNVTPEMIQEKLAEFQKLELLTPDEEESRYLINWGIRLYEQCPEYMHKEIENRLNYYEYVVEHGMVNKAPQVKRHLTRYFTKLEQYMEMHNIFAVPDTDFAKWYEEENEDLYLKNRQSTGERRSDDQSHNHRTNERTDYDGSEEKEIDLAEQEYREWLESMGL